MAILWVVYRLRKDLIRKFYLVVFFIALFFVNTTITTSLDRLRNKVTQIDFIWIIFVSFRIYKDILVVLIIIVVIKCHWSPHKSILFVNNFPLGQCFFGKTNMRIFIFTNELRNFTKLFEEMRSCHGRIYEQLPIVSQVFNSLQLILFVFPGL